MQNMTDELKALLEKAVNKVAAEREYLIPEGFVVRLERPRQSGHGDWATNIAMQLAKPFGTSPRELAAAIAASVPIGDVVDKIEVAGPGFMNFTLSSCWIAESVKSAIEKDEDYGRVNDGAGRRVQIEFVSANPTGLLHVGHGRGAAFGSALVNVLRAAGYDVQAEYYINDAGNQIDNLAASVNARYLELLGQEIAFPENGYRGEDIITTAQGLLDRDGDKYLSWSEEERVAHFKEVALAEKLAILKEHLAAFNVHFDVWFSERTLHQSGAVDEACAS